MTNGNRPDRAGRLHAIRATLSKHGIDALVVSTPLNVNYLTGFSASAQMLLVTEDGAHLITDGRYQFAAREALANGTLAPVTLERVERRYDLTLGATVVRLGQAKVGFESTHVTVANLAAWQRATPGVEWVPCESAVEKLRLIKDTGEIDTLRRGGGVLASVARDLRRLVARGRTEREVAETIDAALLRAGFSHVAFPTIVASGPNSAHPHARPSDRRLAPGDLVVLDFGGVLDGYCVDLTRMVAVGQVAPRAEALFAAVREAHRAAVDASRPGVQTSDIDVAARTVLEARGLGDAFLHATGHGLGLEVHEAPRIARADPDTVERVEAGMVFTIEPGAYVEGVGGVRLEDDVLVTPTGHDVLTDAPLDLLVV